MNLTTPLWCWEPGSLAPPSESSSTTVSLLNVFISEQKANRNISLVCVFQRWICFGVIFPVRHAEFREAAQRRHRPRPAQDPQTLEEDPHRGGRHLQVPCLFTFLCTSYTADWLVHWSCKCLSEATQCPEVLNSDKWSLTSC